MLSAVLLASLVVADCCYCSQAPLVPYRMRPHCCRSLPYYGICPGCGSDTPGPAFDFRTEYNYFWFHDEFHAAARPNPVAPTYLAPAPAPLPTPEEIAPGPTARRTPQRRPLSGSPLPRRTAAAQPSPRR